MSNTNDTNTDEGAWVVIPMSDQHVDRAHDLWRTRFGADNDHIEEWLSSASDGSGPTEGFVAVSGGYVLGFGVVTAASPEWIDGYLNHDGIDLDLERTTGVIHMVCVDEHYESQGIGTELVYKQARYLAATGISQAIAVSWHREDHVDSRPLFRKLGFEQVVIADDFYAEVNDSETVPCVDCEGVCECGATVFKRSLDGRSLETENKEK